MISSTQVHKYVKVTQFKILFRQITNRGSDDHTYFILTLFISQIDMHCQCNMHWYGVPNYTFNISTPQTSAASVRWPNINKNAAQSWHLLKHMQTVETGLKKKALLN